MRIDNNFGFIIKNSLIIFSFIRHHY